MWRNVGPLPVKYYLEKVSRKTIQSKIFSLEKRSDITNSCNIINLRIKYNKFNIRNLSLDIINLRNLRKSYENSAKYNTM